MPAASRFIFAFAWLSAAQVGRADERPAAFDEFSIENVREDGFPIKSFAQTKDGFVWLNFSDWVHRFDGVRSILLNYTFPDFPARQETTHMAAASDGSLWLGFDGAAAAATRKTAPLAIYKAGRRRFIGAPQGLVVSRVTALAMDPDGGAWVGAPEGLVHVPPEPDAPPSAVRAWKSRAVHALLVARNGDLLVGSSGGLGRLRRGGTAIEKEPIDARVVALAEDPVTSTIWAATDGGVVQIRDHAVTRILTAADGLTPGSPRKLLADSRGAVWVGTDGGLCRWNGDKLTASYTTKNGLADGSISMLGEDDQGTVWAGTDRGWVTRFHRQIMWNLGPPEGLPGEKAFGVLQARDGSYFISSSGGISRWRDGMMRSFRAGVEFPAREPRSLAETADGAVFIATLDAGLVRFADGTFRRIAVSDQEPGRGARLVFVDKHDALWIGWEGGGVTRAISTPDPARPGVLAASRTYATGDGLCPTTVIAAAERRAGGLWLTTEAGGLVQLDGKSVRCIAIADAWRAGGAVGPVMEDRDGTVWLGLSQNAGLLRYRNGDFFRYTQENGLACDSIFGIADDRRGHLWTACGVGVSRMDMAELDAFADGRAPQVHKVVRLGPRNGMRSRPRSIEAQPSIVLGHGGSLWVTTPMGVTVISDPDKDPPPRRPPIIEHVMLDGRPLGGNRQVSLAATVDRAALEFHFISPTSGATDEIRYRYRLDGFDPPGFTPSQGRTARYHNVLPGDYVFSVFVANEFGTFVGPAASVTLKLAPVFYRTRSFLAGCLLLAALAVAGAYRLRIRRVAARFEAIRQERARIARDLHDGLGQGFTALAFHLEAMRETLTANDPAKPGAATKLGTLLQQTSDLLQGCHQEARHSIWNLRAADVDTVPFAQQIETAVRDQIARAPEHAPQLRFRHEGPAFPDSAMLRHEVQHIVEEAVANAIRHGGPSAITVRLDGDDRHVRVSVKDDGKGFDNVNDAESAAARGHFGLLGMQERASRLGGFLSVRSQTGRGTEIELEVPRAISGKEESV